MQVFIVLSPTLNIAAPEFIAAWNATPASQAVAQAEIGTAKAVGYPLDPQLQQALVFLGGMAGGVALDVVKDVVKKLITDYAQKQIATHAKPSPITVDTVRQPDGAVLLVVREEDKP